ncbi:DMT family transporter [Variovorax paradoxus]|uniref:EamA-like transporter family protein n=1 Tax=Variovorax paradoxus TaxID=34073 RepID=A0A0H2MP67_VARPD|nr:DMT family transporter [Variovorax paradoxus]KLN58480.1 EamA-like transporter family protein [Variovorax paradoxus]
MVNVRLSAGLAAGVASALIAGIWQVATRHSTTTTIAPADLAILRYGIPAIVLMPVWLRVGLLPRGVPLRWLIGMVLGAGLPFGLVAMTGTRFAPSAHMGVFMAGACPLFAAGLAWMLWHERPDRPRALGLAFLAAGIGILGAGSFRGFDAGAWRGDLLFLLAAALWAGFTLSFRRAGLGAWQGAAVVNAWSAILLVPWLLWRGGTGLLDAPLRDVLWQALMQGAVAGLLGLWVFGAAVARLGASQAAAFGGLAPVFSALGGWWWLAEPITGVDRIAIASAVIGVTLASGACTRGARAESTAG